MRLSTVVMATFSLALLNIQSSFGQAIVGYGINVGRAGAAGAGAGAAGAGAAGIFKRLGGLMSEQGDAKGTQSARTGQPDFDEKDLEKAREEEEEPAFRNSGTMKTEGGVTVSGLSSRRASPTQVRYAARPYNYMPVAPASAQSSASSGLGPAPSQPAPAAAGRQSAEVAAASTPAAGPVAQPDASAEAQPASVSVPSARWSTSTAGENTGGADLAPHVREVLAIDSEIADIVVGTPIDDLVARFGKPLLKMAGLAGEGYNEKYIFRAPDGRRFTVFAQDGAVAEILIEPAELAAL